METLYSVAQSAERILVPKSKDALASVALFNEMTGIEVPDWVWRDEYVISGGRSFRLVPGSDMPGQIVAGWGDMAICSTELTIESGLKDKIGEYIVGDSICRFSVLALNEVADNWRQFLKNTSSKYPIAPRDLPSSFPRLLGMIAAARDLPITPMSAPISGKAEATMCASGIGAVADRVVTGETARRLGAQEVFRLADIRTSFVVRRNDANE